MKDLHVPSSVRREIGLPPGLITVRFAAPDPLDSPGGYRYEIPPEDRKILEQAISDSKSPDKIRQFAAREGLLSGLRVGGSTLGAIMAFGAEQIMNLLGFGVITTLGEASGDKKFTVDNSFGPQPGIDILVTGLKWNVNDNAPTFSITLARQVRNWRKTKSSAGNITWHAGEGAEFVRLKTPRGSTTSNANEVGDLVPMFIQITDEDEGWNGEDTEPSIPIHSITGKGIVNSFDPSSCYRFEAEGKDSSGNTGPHSLSGCLPTDPGAAFDDSSLPDLEGMEPIGALDPALSDLTPAEMQDLLNGLKDSPWGQDYAGLPESDPGDVRLPDPGDMPTPGPGEIPQPNPIEPGIGDGGLPDPDGLSPDIGTPLDNLKLDRDMGLGDLARFDMPLPDDAFGPDGLGAEPPPLPGDNFDPNEFPQGGFPNKGFPKKGFRPGDALKIGIGPDGGFGGKIGKFEPIDPGLGDFTGTAPPFADENFTKPRCYPSKKNPDNRITSIVRDLAVELGLNPDTTFVEPGCDKRFTGCFNKGSSKFDAMWDLADRCGYGVFPDPGDGGGTIAPVTPLRVHHGPYHEDRDLFVFDPVYDDFEVFSHVEVTRPAYRNRPGYSVVLPVNSIYSVPDDKWETRVVGPSVTEADGLDMAARRVRELRRRPMRIEVAVPYNRHMQPRHQAIVSRPTKRFRQNYMITGVRHDLSTEGWLTVWTGVYLDAEESRRYR